MAATSVIKVLDSILYTRSLTRTLGEIQFWRDDNGSILYRVGNSVVLFKVRYQGEWRAMRCYLRTVPRLAEIYGAKYLADELYVFTGYKSGRWIDVVLEPWVDGTTLRSVVERAARGGDVATLKLLSERFDALATELLHSDWAHGDLTAENILVTPELQLRLIDFDCKFLPQFAGQRSSELGTAAYQPPSRRLHDFDANIDDYSIALISTALSALSIDPTLYDRHKFYDGLLFDPQLIERRECRALSEVQALLLAHDSFVAYRVALFLGEGALRIAPLRDIFAPRRDVGREALSLYMKHGLVGYATASGEVAIPPIYDEGLSQREGVMRVKIAEKWVVVDVQNRIAKCRMVNCNMR